MKVSAIKARLDELGMDWEERWGEQYPDDSWMASALNGTLPPKAANKMIRYKEVEVYFTEEQIQVEIDWHVKQYGYEPVDPLQSLVCHGWKDVYSRLHEEGEGIL